MTSDDERDLIYTFDEYVLDLPRRELRRSGSVLPIEPQVFEILAHLVRNRHRVVSKDELISQVWRGRIVSESTLSSRLTDVRHAVDDNGPAKRFIRTYPRVGYRFLGDVVETTEAEGMLEAKSPSSLEECEPPPISIVVLPFRSLGGDVEQEYLADGIVDDITTDMTRLEASFVVARATAMTFKGSPIDVCQVGIELRVRYALQGSIRRVGKEVKINARLVDASSGGLLWAETFQGDLSRLPSLSDEVVLRVGRALKVNLTQAASQRANRLETPSAVDLALQGRAVMHGRITRENYKRARSLFKAALSISPLSVDALAGLGVASIVDYANFVTPPDEPELLRAAETALDRALDIEPHHALARYGRAFLYTVKRKLEDARQEARSAIALDRTLTPAYIRLAQIETSLGNPSEALKWVEQALLISPKDPRSGSAYYAAAHAHTLLGNDMEAARFSRRALGEGFKTHFGYSYLVAALAHLGRQEEAQAALAEMRLAYPNITVTRIYDNRRSDEPTYLEMWQRYIDGLRRAGLPE